MRHIIGAFSTLMVLMLNLLLAISILSISAKTAEAKEYKASVIAEIENSNFNTNVIAACKERARELGYELEVDCSTYEENYDRRIAEITLKYDCVIPLFGVTEKRITSGIAR